VLTGLSSTVLSGAVDVLRHVGCGGGGFGWNGGGKGGVVVGVGICCSGAGECLAECLEHRSCRLLSAGFFLHRDAVVEFGDCLVERVGREVSWFVVRKGFGVDNTGSCSSEWRSARRSS